MFTTYHIFITFYYDPASLRMLSNASRLFIWYCIKISLAQNHWSVMHKTQPSLAAEYVAGQTVQNSK